MSKGTYSHSNRHRMHEKNTEAENEELKRELEECRESYQVLADDYLRLRGLMKRDAEILDYILSDDTNAEVYIQGMLCLALSRDEMEKVIREDPHHPAY